MPEVVGTKAHQRRRYRRKAALCSRVISLRVRRANRNRLYVSTNSTHAYTYKRIHACTSRSASASNCLWYIVQVDIGSYKFQRDSSGGATGGKFEAELWCSRTGRFSSMLDHLWGIAVFIIQVYFEIWGWPRILRSLRYTCMYSPWHIVQVYMEHTGILF